MGTKIVNISPRASAQGLREDLERQATARGKGIRAFVGAIYSYAVKNRGRFAGAINSPRKKPGEHIGATVSETVAKELTQWSNREQTSRSMWCCFILEKALQDDMLSKIFTRESER